MKEQSVSCEKVIENAGLSMNTVEDEMRGRKLQTVYDEDSISYNKLL